MKAWRHIAAVAALALLTGACSSDKSTETSASNETTASIETTPASEPTENTAATETAAAVGSTPETQLAASGDGGLAALKLATTTPAGSKDVDSITWGLYRDVQNLDPVFAFDYPENTVLSILCESPLRQQPDGTLTNGLADVSMPDDSTYVLKVRDGAKFWNGDPVTADDVAFSLGRNIDPAIPSLYGLSYANVAGIKVVDGTVQVSMKSPDFWFRGTLASTSAWVLQKSFTEAAGKDFGNPTGRVMCSGSYKLGDWKTGSPLEAVVNDSYWDPAVKPKVKSIKFIGTPDPIALSAALQSGDVNGYFAFASLPTLADLRADSKVTVTDGAGYQFDALLLAPRKGSALEDARVRKAISLAIDRQGYIDTVLAGGASIPKSFVGPGTWGYARDVFQAGYDALPALNQDMEAAKALIKDGGAEGKSFTIGLIGEIPPMVAEGAMFQKAAEDLGMKVEIKSFPADQYISLFVDPAARADVDTWFTVAYGDAADPGPMLGNVALGTANLNYLPYENPDVRALLEKARGTKDDAARAKITVEAQAMIMNDMPIIPVALPNNTTVTSSNLSGVVPSFAMMFAPWANELGGK